MSILNKIFGDYNEKQVKKIARIVDKIELLDEDMQKLSDEALQNKTIEFKDRLAKGETLDDILIEAFAVVREASSRVMKMKHYREQMIGGIVLHQGRIAEMKTGEGKTLVATLPAYLNALSGKGVHVITVNDYLAQRDAQEMSHLYGFLGLSTGVVIHGITPIQRQEAYACDITYGTNNEFGFDYLRDNMVIYKEEKSQRPLNFCIVDEVDSILIDEARTPLIISGPGDKSTDFYKVADMFVKTLKEEIDYTIDEKGKAVLLTEEGMSKAEVTFAIENYADAENLSLQHFVTQALKANYIMKKDTDYMVKNNEIMIVDEFTGRLMEGRRYSDGLHQAIEAKENVEIKRESKTLATITFQNYFRMYEKLSGMTGTAATEETEFREIYSLDVVIVPTHRPIQRIDHVDLVYTTLNGKYKAIIEDIIRSKDKGQPVLVGTTSIEKSEYLSSMLKERGIEHQVLNAKYHEEEAEIVARAGEVGRITIATNMAGRGTDIKLKEDALAAGGLKIIGTERHESRRIDNQLRGRSGRQGDVGESIFYLSLEDELMRLFGSEKLQSLTDKLGIEDDHPIEASMVARAIENAQKKVEGAHFNSRKNVLGYDDVMNLQRTLIYSQRETVLNGEDMKDKIIKMITSEIENAVSAHMNVEYDEDIKSACKTLIAYMEDLCIPHKEVSVEDIESLNNNEMTELFKKIVLDNYNKKEEIYGSDNMRELERVVLLRCVDKRWMEHITNMDHLKQGIGLRAYKQQDPVQAYQMEGSVMFEEMVAGITYDTVKYLTHVKVYVPENTEEEETINK